MNSPNVISAAKALFHALTVASTALASFSTFVPPKYALYAALVSSAISGALHVITTLFPAASGDESGIGAKP